jgi:hypothetical protein
MLKPVTSRIADLAESLGDLRCRLSLAARREVALAVGDALKELTHVWICGPARDQYSGGASSAWQESGQEEDPWAEQPHPYSQEEPMPFHSTPPLTTRLPNALTAGLGAARGGLTRTQNVIPAVALGVVAGVVVYAGGSSIDTLVRLWVDGADLSSLRDVRHVS